MSQSDRDLLLEATRLLYDWDALTLTARGRSIVRETEAFLRKIGYDDMTGKIRPADQQSGAQHE